MTEVEWLAGTDPRPMLHFLQGKAADRKFRLLACARCRREPAALWTADLAERIADGLVSEEERRWLCEEAQERLAEVVRQNDLGYVNDGGVYSVEAVLCDSMNQVICSGGFNAASAAWGLVFNEAEGGIKPQDGDLVREIFGNPFRPPILDPRWLTPGVLDLAQAAYENRLMPAGHLDRARLGVLADALEEAGCDNAEVLGHLRLSGPHARGCWAVDLLLGKE